MSAVIADWLLAYWLHGVALCLVVTLLAHHVASRPATRAVLWRVALLAPPFTAAASLASGIGARASVTALVRPHVAPAWRGHDVDVRVVRRAGAAPRRTVVTRDPLADRTAQILTTLAALAAFAGGASLARRRRVARRSLASRIPVALPRGEIRLPVDSLGALDAAARHAVMLHEHAHVRRRDPEWLDAARWVAALAWWQPLNRVALRALRHATEMAADDDALACGAERHALVAGLAHFAALVERDPLTVGASIADADSPLVARARRILECRATPPAEPRALLVVCALAALLGLALLPRPTVGDDGAPPRPGVRVTDVRFVDR